MFLEIDYSKRKHKAKIQLAKPTKQIISNISEKYNDSLSLKLGNINELNFSIPHTITENFQLIRNPHVDMIREKMLLKVTIGSQNEWFIVDSIGEDGDDTDTFNVTAYSLGFELTHKRIGIYEKDAIGCSELIGDLLEGTSWTIGSIDNKFTHMMRYFSTSKSNSLDALIEASETFGAIISWNTVERKVSFKDIKEIGLYKGLSVDYGRLLKSISRNRTTDEMTTRLYIYGNEDLSIHAVNVTGQPYIEDFSYFMYPFERDAQRNVIEHSAFMSDELCHAILDHKEVLNDNAPDIAILVANSLDKQSEILAEESWLSQLNRDMEIILTRIDVAKSAENQALIDSLTVEKQQKEVEIDNKNSFIDILKVEYLDINLELESLRADVLMESNFTSSLLEELSFYIIEKEWSDDRYIDAQELYDDGLEKFIEMRQPKVVITIDIENLFEIMEEQHNWNRLVLGDLIKVRYPQMAIEYLARIIQIDHDLEGGAIKITIANTNKTGDEMEQLKAILSNSQTASTVIQNNLHKWNKIHLIDGEVTKLINDEWDANKRKITAGVNNQIEIGSRGIIIRNPDMPEEVVIIQSGIIALSKDSGDSWKTAIKPDGIIAERLIGKVLLGTRLIIEDEKGIMRFTGSLQEIFDNNGVAKVEIGEYETGVYGLRIDNGAIEIINGLPKNQIDPFSVEQWDNAEDNAIAYANNLKVSIDGEIADIQLSLDNLNAEIGESFRDGVISEAEANAIATYINILVSEKTDIDSRYNSIYSNPFNVGTFKTNLLNAKASYDTAHTNLINSINTAISDKATTIEEKTDVDNKFVLYRTSITTLSQRFEEAIDSISSFMANNAEANAVQYADDLKVMIDGEIADLQLTVNRLDAEIGESFRDGVISEAEANAIATYINLVNTEKSDTDSRYNTIYNDSELTGTPKTNLLNAKTSYNTAHTNLINSINTAIQDSATTLAEKQDVDNKFISFRTSITTLSQRLEEAIDFIAQAKANNAETNANSFTQGKINEVIADIGDVDDRVTTLNSYVDGAFEDGIIQQSEAIAISTYINSLNTEKADLDNKYNNVYNNASVLGTFKTNLYNAKTAYDTGHTNLISSINTAIADGKTTSTEKTDVDAKFATYRTNLGTLSTRFEEAIRSMDTNSTIRTDLRLTAPLPTSISLNANGITATTATSTNFARLDYRGLYVQGGAIDIRTSTVTNRGIVFDGTGIRGYNSSGIRKFEIDTNGNAYFSGDITGSSGTFYGSLSAVGGTFSGNLSGASGTFSGNLSGASGTFSGNLSGASGTFGTITGGTITGTTTISGGNISVTTNISVGDNIYLGNGNSDWWSERNIYFNYPHGVARIMYMEDKIYIQAMNNIVLEASYITIQGQLEGGNVTAVFG